MRRARWAQRKSGGGGRGGRHNHPATHNLGHHHVVHPGQHGVFAPGPLGHFDYFTQRRGGIHVGPFAGRGGWGRHRGWGHHHRGLLQRADPNGRSLGHEEHAQYHDRGLASFEQPRLREEDMLWVVIRSLEE